MPPREQKNSNALAILRRAGTDSVMSMVRVAGGPQMSSMMLRMFLRDIHLQIMSRKEEYHVLNETENMYAPEQVEGAEPVLKFVRVAMKPSPTKIDNEWDESGMGEVNSNKWTAGLSSRTAKKRPSMPAFVLKEIPYDVWRKHYAKDKYGRYRGTEAPAENCILLPEDEKKWRSGPLPGESCQSTKSEDVSPNTEGIKRSATLPLHRVIDPELSLHTETAPEVPMQKEEAVFIEPDGHMASEIIEEPRTTVASPFSPAPSTSLDPPGSPTSPVSTSTPTSPTSRAKGKSWKDRVGTFAKLRRSSSVEVIQ